MYVACIINVVTFELETLKMALDVMLRVVLENAPLAELAKDVVRTS